MVSILPQGEKLNKQFHEDHIIRELHKRHGSDKCLNIERNLTLHMDNAPTHRVDGLPSDLCINRLVHPPYSPDLAIFDFFLFGFLKMKLEGSSIESPVDLKVAVEEIISGIGYETWRRVFREWTDRLKKCVENGGEYVE